LTSTLMSLRKHKTVEINKQMECRAWHLLPVFHVD